MAVIINPGTGPVSGATLEQATINIQKFRDDVGVDGVRIIVSDVPDNGRDGRYSFTLVAPNGRESYVNMPGIPLEKVRYMNEEGQNIWDFPRLYEGGSSWVWYYAINQARNSLIGEVSDE